MNCLGFSCSLADQAGGTVPEKEDAEQVGAGATSMAKAEATLSPCCAQGSALDVQDLASPYPKDDAEGDCQAFIVTTVQAGADSGEKRNWCRVPGSGILRNRRSGGKAHRCWACGKFFLSGSKLI